MNVLLLGSGGRESAMAWKIAQSPLLSQLFITPGNGGTSQFGQNVNLNPLNFEQIGLFCIDNNISLVIVGPEEPLVKGIVDHLQSKIETQHVLVFGPSATGAQLEGSKDFAKKFMQRHQIPTAAYATFNGEEFEPAIQFLEGQKAPYVIKADGLAAGKGVLILNNKEEATQALQDILLGGSFGEAGNKVVIEEFLTGIEFSVFAAFDGSDYILLPEAKDYKRIGEGDTGPNTGGMGTLSPVPFYNEALKNKVIEKIVKPTFDGLKKENIDYKGMVFFGLINVAGEPFVIEYNCRLGDPETESILPRLESDFLEICLSAAQGNLKNLPAPTFSVKHAATVILVAEGYPGFYNKGTEITFSEHSIKDAYIFHAGTQQKEGKTVSSGGRVIALTAMGNSLQEAIKKAYELKNHAHFEGCNYRRDIGYEFIS